MTSPPFDSFFRSSNSPRDKYLSRLFGLFNEDVVRHWCVLPETPYSDLGRPTLKLPGEPRGYTLDFTLQHQATGHVFVTEMKCWLEYEGYKYLRLRGPDQLRGVDGKAFARFLDFAEDPSQYLVQVKGKPVKSDGAILIWGAIGDEGREKVIREHGLSDVLSVEVMLEDLRGAGSGEWERRVGELRGWSEQLFNYLN